MNQTRRKFIIGLVGGLGAIGIIGASAGSVRACMYGTWVVRCSKGHDDTVEDGTCQHECETCGEQTMPNGDVTIVCPGNHANFVRTGNSRNRNDVLKSYACRTCGKECRRDV